MRVNILKSEELNGMSRIVKVLLASLMVASGFIAPATADGVAISGKVTAIKDLSLVGAKINLEKYDANADTYTAVATATVTPSPAPTSTSAPYKFDNVEDGTYRVNYPLAKADVLTSRFGVSNSEDFVVTDGKITVKDKPYLTIPDFKMNAMGRFAVKAVDPTTSTAIPNAVFTISGSFNGEDTTFASFTDPNALGTAILPVPAAGSYSIKIVDPTGMHQTLTTDDKPFIAGFSNASPCAASSCTYKPNAGGNLAVTVSSGANNVAGAVVHLLSADEEVAVATANKSGVANFLGLPVGDLNMWVGGPIGSPLKDSDAKSVTIVAGQTVTASQALVNGFTISGLLSSTDGPVAGARVDVEKVDADGTESPASPTETGKDGRFVTNGLDAGTYNLYFFDETSDLQDFRMPGSLPGVVVTTGNIVNQSASLPSAGVVTGRATATGGAAVSTTTVELINAYGDTVATSATDNKGVYRFPRIVAGSYTVKFSNDAYRVSYSDEFTVQANKISTQDITLVSGSGIAGKVTSTVSGQTFEGVRVSIYSSLGSGLTPDATTITQADGTYQVSGLKPGVYRIKFDASDSNPTAGAFWQPVDQAKTNAKSFGQAGDITTQPGYTVNNVNPVPVTPWASVTGKVTVTNPTDGVVPVENATVTVVSSDGLVARAGSTDPDGNFAISVPDGEYGIKIASAGYSTGYVGSVTDQPTLVAGFADSVKVNVIQGKANFENSWYLKKWSIDLAGNGGSVKVTVVDDAKDPVSEGVLVAYDRQGNAVAFTDTCDDSGTFVLSGLRGKFSFSYESAGAYAKRFVGGTAKLSDAGTTVANVTDGAALKFNLATVALPTLAIKIVTSTDAKAPLYTDDATVEVYTLRSGKWTLDVDLTVTTNEGTANIGVTGGASYRIRVLPDSYLLAPVWVGGVPLANTVEDASTIVIPSAGKAPILDNVVVNVATGVIKGHIADSFEGDVSGAIVELVDSSGNVIKRATSREDGVYNLYRVSPDTYTLKFVAERYAIKYVNDVSVLGGSQTPVNVSLRSASGITGQLVSADDKPVVGATVTIYGASGSGVTPIQTVSTNEDGTYNFIGLLPGSYKIRFDGTTADTPTSAFWYSNGKNVDTFKDASAVVTTLGAYTKNVDPKPAKSWALIKGTILDSANTVSGAAVSLVTVSLATLTGKVVATAVTDENGNFALYAPDGSYQIQVEASGFATGFIDASAGDAVLNASAIGAAIVSVDDNVAKIDSGLNANDLTVDLAGSGGSITVTVKDDADKTVTDGEVMVYDASGNEAGFAVGAQAGVFTIAGLNGTYRVSYTQDGVFAKTLYGDTSNIADPKTKTAKIDKTNKPAITINVKTLPKLTVNVVDGATPAAAFDQPVTVEVYNQIDGEWTLNSALTQETSSGSVSFGVVNDEEYRIRVVPNSELLTPVWVGAARLAKSVRVASSITIPAKGAAPVLGNVVMNSLAGVLDGNVSDSDSVGIPGAEVSLIDNSGAVADSVSTRSDGGYHFRQIVGGTYTVKFVADGYGIKYAKKYQIVGGQSTTLDAKLTPATGISGRALLTGQPTAPIVGADVSVYTANGSGLTPIQTVQTDEEGNYNFIGLMPGSYKVYFDNSNAVVPAESFWYGADANAATFKDAASITATLGAYSSGIDPQPVTPWTLFTGNIHDGQWAVVGGSVSLVSVSLISVSGNSALTGITDDSGNFAIYAPDGAYRIKIVAAGYMAGYVDSSAVGTAILSASAATATVLSVSQGNVAFDSGLTGTSLSLDLGASGGKISLTVKDELGQVVTDGVVSAYDKTGKVVATDDSSINGVFTLAGLRGYYRVSYQLDGVFAETFVGDTKDLGSAGTKTITVTDGANIAASIKVKTLPKLTVNIYSGGTTPYKQPVTVEVYTLTDDQWLLDTGLTQETSEGVLAFGVENLNQYRIRLVPANSALAPVWLGANASALTVGSAKSILIPAAGAVPAVSGSVNVNAATISGAVTDSFKTVMPGVTVQLLAANGDLVSETTTIEDGSYTFIQVIPGTYTFRFAAERFSDKVVRSVVIAAGATPTQNAVLESASGISGRVLGTGAGQTLLVAGPRLRGLNADLVTTTPVVGATVGLYAATGNGLSALRTEVTDENGYYNFSGLVPGSYRIRIDGTTATPPTERVWYAGSDANAAEFTDATIVKAVRGELVTDLDPAPVKFWTAFDGVIKAGTLAVSGATVTLVAVKGDDITAQTDADGFISVYAPDGDYRVKIAAEGYPRGYVSDTESGVALDTIAANATLLHVANGVAAFTSGLDLMSDPLDLAAIGGSLQVQVLDGTTPVTEGVLTVYNRAGEVVAYTESATGGVFTVDGLRGEYKVSYQLPGTYALTFVGGTKTAADPKSAQVRVRDKGVTLATIAAVALPKFTVSVKSGSATYAQPVTVNVFAQDDKGWKIQPDLGGTTFTGSYVFGVTRGENYRVQVVADDLNMSSAWVGDANALSVDTATSYAVPLTGNAPALPAVTLLPAVQVTVPLMNSRPVALENVVAHVEVTQSGKFVEFDAQALGTLESGATGTVTISHVPASMFPIRVTGTSSNSAEVSWTSQAGVPAGDLTSDTLKFSQVAIPAVLTGSIKTVDGTGVSGQTVTLVSDEGDEYASMQTDDSGNYKFIDLPLGVHFTVSSNPESGFLVAVSDSDFTARSGDELEISFIQHYSVVFGGVVLDADGNPRAEALVNIYHLSGAKLDIQTDDVYSVYTDSDGNWTFDGSEVGAEVGQYAFFADGLDSDFTPAYLGNADCANHDTLPNPSTSCAVAKAEKAAVITTNKDVQSLTSITLALGAPDNSAPTGVKISKAPLATTTVTPTWQWTGKDSTDGSALRSEVVVSFADYGKPMGAWSDPIDVTGNSYSITGVRGTTYCLSVRMVDKSGNASAFTTPSCTTFAMDDTAMKPAKAALWAQIAVKGSFLGKVTSAKKNAKSAVLNVTKATAGKSLCIYYVTGAKFGAFTVTVNGKKLGKPVATAGKAGQIKSICYVTSIKASSKIVITVPKAGNGVQIDGYAITLAAPKAPVPPAAEFKSQK